MVSQFGNFQASELYCPRCQRAQPVQEHLLLVLPDGELHEYRCARCAASLGTRRTRGGSAPTQAAPPPSPTAAPRRVRGLLR